jgi:hypothetical protein
MCGWEVERWEVEGGGGGWRVEDGRMGNTLPLEKKVGDTTCNSCQRSEVRRSGKFVQILAHFELQKTHRLYF